MKTVADQFAEWPPCNSQRSSDLRRSSAIAERVTDAASACARSVPAYSSRGAADVTTAPRSKLRRKAQLVQERSATRWQGCSRTAKMEAIGRCRASRTTATTSSSRFSL